MQFVEVIVGPSTSAARLELVLYNGANGKMYRSLPLVDNRIFHVTDGGFGFLIYTAALPIQNGPGDGIALVSGSDGDCIQVVQFISYEGLVKAIDGPAMGAESTDIGLQETQSSSETDSLGLTGRQAGEFKWRKFINRQSPGKLNMGQILSSS